MDLILWLQQILPVVRLQERTRQIPMLRHRLRRSLRLCGCGCRPYIGRDNGYLNDISYLEFWATPRMKSTRKNASSKHSWKALWWSFFRASLEKQNKRYKHSAQNGPLKSLASLIHHQQKSSCYKLPQIWFFIWLKQPLATSNHV